MSVREIGQLTTESAARVAGRIGELLARRGMSGRQLAAAVEMPPSTINDILRGKSDPSLGTLVRIAHVLELRSIEELVAPLGTSHLRRSQYGGDVVV